MTLSTQSVTLPNVETTALRLERRANAAVDSEAISLQQNTCIVHVGMPKTGTTAIQESMFTGLADPKFHYMGLGYSNAVFYLAPVFGITKQTFCYNQLAYSSNRIKRLARGYEARFRRALRSASSRERCPIISAEFLWQQHQSFFENFRDFLAAEGFSARVIAYVRPIKSFIDSNMQQLVKLGKSAFDPTLRARGIPNRLYRYAEKVEMLERVFGTERVTVRPYVKSALVEGCVVRDFCHTLGIHFEPRSVIHANRSLCADAVKMLFAYNRVPSIAAKIPRLGLRYALTVAHLEEMPGAPLRFHSGLLGEVRAEIEAQNSAMRRKHGIDISEDIEAADRGPCIRSEEDMLRFSRASLDWLSKATATAPIGPMEGEVAAGEVALRVARLWRRIPPRVQARMVLERLRRKTRRVLRGE